MNATPHAKNVLRTGMDLAISSSFPRNLKFFTMGLLPRRMLSKNDKEYLAAFSVTTSWCNTLEIVGIFTAAKEVAGR